MNPILAMLFGGQTRTERKDLTKAKDFPPFLLNATKKLAKAIGNVSPILGAMLDMEAGFMLLDGSATANGAKRCRSFSQEQHRIVNSNGDTLVGTLYKADVPSDVIVLCVHGYRMNAESEFSRYIPAYHDMGYHVFAYHQTGAGLSEGKYVTFGIQESNDGVQWVKYLAKLYPEAKICLHGDSLGAATVLMMTGKSDLPDAVRCAVADSAYASAEHEFTDLLGEFHIPGRPLYKLVRKMFLKESGYDLNDADPLSAVARSKTPTLFIHGTADVLVPTVNVDRVYGACAAEKDLIRYPDAHHCQSEYFYHEEYFEKIECFHKRYL